MEKRLINVAVNELVPYWNNPRKNKKAVGAVSESIRQTGYNKPIVVDENLEVLAGHTRIAALKKLGTTETQVLQVTGLTEEQKRKYRLLDNKAGEYSNWDYVLLAEELQGIDWEGLELDWGLDAPEPEEEEEQTAEKEHEKDTGEEYECPECGCRFRV